MNKGFPYNLYEKDLLSLYNILQLAKGDDRKKTIAELDNEVKKELERRLNETENSVRINGD